MRKGKQDSHRFIVPLVLWAVCAAIASHAGATGLAGRTVAVARETELVSFGTATSSKGSVVAWVARRRDGTRALKAAWIPWNSSVPGETMTLAEGVGDLTPQPVAREDGSFWIIYTAGEIIPDPPTFFKFCIDCSILARIISAAGPVGHTPVTLAVAPGALYELHANARPEGGLLLWWWRQGLVTDSINHESMRAFDSQGIPLAAGSELLGGESERLAVADDGGALLVGVSNASEQGIPFDYLTGGHYDSNGAFLRGVQLTPPTPPGVPLEEYDVSRAAGGGYWLTWHEGPKLMARRVTADGDPEPAVIAGADPTAAPLAATPDDGFLVCRVSHGKLLIQLHGEDARPRGGPLLLAHGVRAPSFIFPLQLAVTATGRGVVAWWSPSATDRSQTLFLTRFSVASRPTGGR